MFTSGIIQSCQNITKLENMEEQLDDNVSIYCGTTIDDISVSRGDEWDRSNDYEKKYSAINQLT